MFSHELEYKKTIWEDQGNPKNLSIPDDRRVSEKSDDSFDSGK